MAGNYAVIESGIVKNIIIAESGYEYDGAELIEYPESVFCQPGCFITRQTGYFTMIKNIQK